MHPFPLTPIVHGDDAVLFRLGREHAALLDACRSAAATVPPPSPDPLDALSAAVAAVEERIAATPARTLAGLLIRLGALWSSLDHADGGLFTPPDPGAGLTHRLVWSLIEDVTRLAGPPG